MNNRTITFTGGNTTDLGILHSGSTVNVAANTFSSTGLYADTTSVTVAGGTGVADHNGVTLTGSTSTFNGATSSPVDGSTQTFGGTISGAGTVTGSFTLGVTGEGLAGEVDPTVVEAYTANVYSGQGVWAGTGASGSWARWPAPVPRPSGRIGARARAHPASIRTSPIPTPHNSTTSAGSRP